MLEERQQDTVIDTLIRLEIEVTEALRETDGPRTPDAVTAAVRLHEATRETLRAALVYNDYAAVETPLERSLSRLGLSVTRDGEAWPRLARRAARALLEVADENIRREHGIYATDDRLPAALTHGGRPQALPEQPAVAAQGLPALPPRPCFAGENSPRTPQPIAAAMKAAASQAPAEPHPEIPVPVPSPATARVPEVTKAPRADALKEAPPKTLRPAVEEQVRLPKDASRDPETLTSESPFSAWFGAALAAKREETPGWDTNNLGNWMSTRKLFIEAHGDRPMSFYKKEHFLELRSLLQATPKSHHKSSDSPSLYTIIEEAEIKERRDLVLAENQIAELKLNRGDAEQLLARVRYERMKVATVYRHLQAIQFIFENAAEWGAVPPRMLKGVLWSKKQLEKLKGEEKNASRLAWGDKLKDLLATSAFVTLPADGNEVHAVFWPTLLAAHAGLREEEALQLRAEDVDTMKGIPILRIQSGEGQHIKSGTRYRIVPIHKNLIALGFLAFVEDCRRRGQDWLFPEIGRCAAKGRLSGIFTKIFGRYRLQEGVYDPRRDFHSLRTHFNVELKRDTCPLEIRKRLLGHRIRDVTEEHYDPEGSPIHEFKEWVDRIDIDITDIRSPWAPDHGRTSEPDARNVVAFGRR